MSRSAANRAISGIGSTTPRPVVPAMPTMAMTRSSTVSKNSSREKRWRRSTGTFLSSMSMRLAALSKEKCADSGSTTTRFSFGARSFAVHIASMFASVPPLTSAPDADSPPSMEPRILTVSLSISAREGCRPGSPRFFSICALKTPAAKGSGSLHIDPRMCPDPKRRSPSRREFSSSSTSSSSIPSSKMPGVFSSLP